MRAPDLADCEEFAWPGGGALNVYTTTGVFQGLEVTVSDTTFTDCRSQCESLSSSDFFTATGGGMNVIGYGDTFDDVHIRVVNSRFHQCQADYGGGIELDMLTSQSSTCTTPRKCFQFPVVATSCLSL